MQNWNALAASAFALLVATPVFAQGALVGVDDLDERIDDIQEDIDDDLRNADARDRSSNQYAQGWAGSVALGFSTTSGNTDTTDLDLAGRFRYGNGPWNHTFGFAVEVGEANDVRNNEEAFATYDVNRYFTDRFYVFGLGSARYDDFGSNRYDVFFGFGPGYRVVNQENQSWRLQAGPGIRYLEDQFNNDTTDVAGIVSSRYFLAINENVYLTNDTDVLFSETDTLVTNDLGVNFRVTDAISTRVSYRTKWNDSPLPGFDSTDNSLGVSLVYGF